MKKAKRVFSPRSKTITIRVRESSIQNLEDFCEKYGFYRSEAVDLLFQWLKRNGKDLTDTLKELREKDYDVEPS